MGGQVDVLRVIDQSETALVIAGLSPDSIFPRELREARAAIAELMAADKEYDEARAAHADYSQWLLSSAAIPAHYHETSREVLDRLHAATARRASALAAVGGNGHG